MVFLHPPIYITLLPCKRTWKQAKRISSRQGDVYLLNKNTCSAKMKSMCISLDEQIAIEQMKSDFEGWVWCSSMNLHRLFITISVLHAVKIFVSQIWYIYKNDSHKEKMSSRFSWVKYASSIRMTHTLKVYQKMTVWLRMYSVQVWMYIDN